MRRTPRSASTSGRRDDEHLAGHLGGDRRRLGGDGADVDDGQRVARLDRAEHVAGDAWSRRPRPSRPPRARAAAGSRPCACRASPAGGGRRSRSTTSTRSTTLRRCGVSSSARKSPFWRSKSTRQTGRPGRHPGRGEPEVQRDRGRPDAALGARHRDELAAERAAGRLLAGHAVAHRARPLRGRAHAGLEGLERQRERDDVAQAGLHRGAQQPGRVLGGEQDQPDLGEGAERSRARSSTGVPPSASCSSTTSTSSRRSARVDLVEVGDDVDDVELGLARLRGRAAGGLVVGDGDQQAGAHRDRPPCPLGVLARGRSSRRACGRRGRRGAAARAGRRRRTTLGVRDLSSWRLSSANVTGTTCAGSAGRPGRRWRPSARGAPTAITARRGRSRSCGWASACAGARSPSSAP